MQAGHSWQKATTMAGVQTSRIEEDQKQQWRAYETSNRGQAKCERSKSSRYMSAQ